MKMCMPIGQYLHLQLLLLASISRLATTAPSDLSGYWTAETVPKSPLPSALICLRFQIVSSDKATFHEIRKLSWAEPSERSVSISLRGMVAMQERLGKEYPKPNGALNFSVATSTFRYAEPSNLIPALSSQSNAMVGQQRACVYAFGGEKTDDTNTLRLRCFPEVTSPSGLNAVLGFGTPTEYPALVQQQSASPITFTKDPKGECVVYHTKRFIRTGVVRPRQTGYVLWVQLAAVFTSWQPEDTARVITDLSEYHSIPERLLSVVSVSEGSVVLQVLVSDTPRDDKNLLASAQKMRTELEDGLVTLGDSVLLMMELEWFEYYPSFAAENGMPGWSVTVLLLSGSLWLCWVAYTVQCRRMVLELEEKYSEKHPYQRVPRKKAVDVDNNPISG